MISSTQQAPSPSPSNASNVTQLGPAGFLPELEALRGLAALAVVVEHTFLYADGPLYGWLNNHPGAGPLMIWLTHVLFNGRAAVVLFFVISGFVLARQMAGLRGSVPVRLQSYLVRRLFRIVPAMWAAILFAYGFAWVCHPELASEPWLLTKTLFLQDFRLDTPLWSLKAELVCSLLFPLLYWFKVRRSPVAGVWLLLPLAGALFLPHHWQGVDTARYLVFFQVGILAGTHGAAALQAIAPRWRTAAFLAAWAVLALSSQLWPFYQSVFNFHDDRAYLMLDIPASFLVMSFVVHGRLRAVRAVLRSRLASHLGKISFSLYLLHYVFSNNLWAEYAGAVHFEFVRNLAMPFALVFFALIFYLTWPLAVLSHRFIEVPFNNLGRRISRHIEGHASPPAHKKA
jgi:peptidoglycan/LPS O-acetylase OafA/YrhL